LPFWQVFINWHLNCLLEVLVEPVECVGSVIISAYAIVVSQSQFFSS
jgi:hypothetical protein